MALLALGIGIADAAQVDLADTPLDEPVDGLSDVILVKVPEPCKVVHHAIGYHTQRNLVTNLLLLHHQTVHSIIQCRVATYDDDGLVAI